MNNQHHIRPRELFPEVVMTKGARAKAQAYINATIEMKGCVESCMYGMRNSLDHIVRDVYFPEQTAERIGIRVDIPALINVGKEIFKRGLIPSTMIHHHCYSALGPSTTGSMEFNDEDDRLVMLQQFKSFNYLEKIVKLNVKGKAKDWEEKIVGQGTGEFFYDENSDVNIAYIGNGTLQELVGRDELRLGIRALGGFIRISGKELTLETDGKGPSLYHKRTNIRINYLHDAPVKQLVSKGQLEILIPDRFSYVYAIIMNPTVALPVVDTVKSVAKNAWDLVEKISSIPDMILDGFSGPTTVYDPGSRMFYYEREADLVDNGAPSTPSFGNAPFKPMRRVSNKSFQKDRYHDPHVTVTYQRWGPLVNNGRFDVDDTPHSVDFMELPLKVVDDVNDVKFDYAQICQEVKERLRVGFVQRFFGGYYNNSLPHTPGGGS